MSTCIPWMTYAVTDECTRPSTFVIPVDHSGHSDADVRGIVWHIKDHVEKRACLGNCPIESNSLGACADAGGLDFDISDTGVEVGRGLLGAVKALNDRVGPERRIGHEDRHVQGIPDQERVDQHVDRVRDLVSSSRDIDVGWSRRESISFAGSS